VIKSANIIVLTAGGEGLVLLLHPIEMERTVTVMSKMKIRVIYITFIYLLDFSMGKALKAWIA